MMAMIARPLRRLFRYGRRHRRTLALATTYSVCNKLFDLAPPALIGAAVDIVVAREASVVARFGVTDVGDQLLVLGGLTLLIWGFESLFEYLYGVAWRNLAQTIQHELRVDAYDHLQGLELAYFEDRSTGGLMAVLGDDINQLERFLDTGANEIIQLCTTILVVGGLFVVAIPTIAPLAMLPMPLVIGGSIWFQRRLEPLYAAVRERVSGLSARLANNLSGIATIKSFVAEARETDAMRGESLAYAEANGKAIALSSAFVPLIRMFIVLGFVAILVYGGELALSGGLGVGLYSVLVFMTQRLLWPLTRLGSMLDQYRRAMASTQRILDLLDTVPEMTSGTVALPKAQVQGRVGLEGLRFSYRTGGEVLRGIDLDIAAGSTVALVGPTGSGKSTVVKLLLRLYDATGGRVTIDGHDVRDLDRSDLRRAIGLVSQDVFVFHGSVRDNIAYGSFDATDADLERAARLAEAHAFIEALPQGYDTVVGERGQKLSGGQRQLARAIVKDPPILVLDEATSAVDNETEAAILRSLEKIAVGRTTIVIAHRLSTIRGANRIFVLDGGEVTQAGDHDTLVAQRGTYRALWRVQTGNRASN
jgi:ATP-binding cassette subfamily B protein